jgi:DNA-binding NarL/FixJ family response regulator
MTTVIEAGSAGSPGTGVDAPSGTSIVVQQRQRLFREGVSRLLDAEADLRVVAMAITDAELVGACREHRPAVVVMEGDATDWDVARLVTTLRRLVPGLAAIGVLALPAAASEEARARRAGMCCLLSRDTGIAGILRAIRGPASSSPRARSPWTTRAAPPARDVVLTVRELEVLSLVAAGLTSGRVAARLQISHKTVENHKQRIFAKLGVQNQAHAVSTAIRSGVLRPERLMELASGN